MLRRLVLLVVALATLAACGTVRGVDTHEKTVPIYHKEFERSRPG